MVWTLNFLKVAFHKCYLVHFEHFASNKGAVQEAYVFNFDEIFFYLENGNNIITHAFCSSVICPFIEFLSFFS